MTLEISKLALVVQERYTLNSQLLSYGKDAGE